MMKWYVSLHTDIVYFWICITCDTIGQVNVKVGCDPLTLPSLNADIYAWLVIRAALFYVPQ